MKRNPQPLAGKAPTAMPQVEISSHEFFVVLLFCFMRAVRTPLMSTLRRGETGKSDWWPSGAMEDLSLPTPRDRRQRYDALDLAIPRSFGQQRRLTASLHRTFQASAHQEGMAGTAQPPRHQPPPPLSARPSYRPTTQGRNLRVAGFSLSRYSRRSKSQQPRPQTLPTLQSSPWDAPKQTPVISLQALLHMLTRLALRLVCEAKLWDWARQAFHACDRNNNGFAPFHSLTAVYHTMVPPPISPVALHQMYNQQLEARHTSVSSAFLLAIAFPSWFTYGWLLPPATAAIIPLWLHFLVSRHCNSPFVPPYHGAIDSFWGLFLVHFSKRPGFH